MMDSKDMYKMDPGFSLAWNSSKISACNVSRPISNDRYKFNFIYFRCNYDREVRNFFIQTIS